MIETTCKLGGGASTARADELAVRPPARLSYLPPVAVAAAGEVEPMVQVADAGGDKR